MLARALRTSEDALFKSQVTILELDALVERLAGMIDRLAAQRPTWKAANAARLEAAAMRAAEVRRRAEAGEKDYRIAPVVGLKPDTVRKIRARPAR